MTGLLAFIRRRPVLSYYLLTFAITWGVLIVVMVTRGLPADKGEMAAVLPFAILGSLLGPSVSGLLMTAILDGRAGLRRLGAGLRSWRARAGWYAVALLAAPALVLTPMLTLSWFSPVYLPGIFTLDDKLGKLILSLTAAIVVGILEEIGWTGFVTPRLRQRYSALKTGLVIGVLWGLWHVLPMAILPSAAYAPPVSPLTYMALRTLSFLFGGLVAFRVLMLWVYEHTHSLLMLVLMHFSLTFSNMLFEPQALAGTANFILDLAGLTVMWLAAGVVIAATRGRLEARA